jgi:hypothetical protein
MRFMGFALIGLIIGKTRGNAIWVESYSLSGRSVLWGSGSWRGTSVGCLLFGSMSSGNCTTGFEGGRSVRWGSGSWRGTSVGCLLFGYSKFSPTSADIFFLLPKVATLLVTFSAADLKLSKSPIVFLFYVFTYRLIIPSSRASCKGCRESVTLY